MFSLENITTTGQNEFCTSCEADVVFTAPEFSIKGRPVSDSNLFRGHSEYVVRITADGSFTLRQAPHKWFRT